MSLPARLRVQPTVILALALMTVIAMMVLPVPAWLLDIGLALSFALAILMLTVALFIERPLDFSAFPTILLASLLLRLALNVASTKLIISQGHTGTDAAGHVIEAFAEFVMGGDLVLGLVIFVVILIVNFLVITKGAGRMAEVGARFALDGLPGRQLAIDADVAAGAIDHAEAKLRRERELAETSFFGSLDGASKFVKGDAIAGLVITAINLIVGLCVGVFGHDLPFGQALETYTILTVGDGLVTQIPAVIISVAAALLMARGGGTGAADVAFFAQLSRYPAALLTVAGLLAAFALVPGLPIIPFLTGAILIGYMGWRRLNLPPPTIVEPVPAGPPPPRPMGDMLDFDEIHVEFASDLVAMALDPATGLDRRVGNMRNHIATGFGFILPEIRLTDEPSLAAGQYRIRIQGVERVRDRLMADRVLVLLVDGVPAPPGVDVREPVFGAPARWIMPDAQETAALSGLTTVSPAEVLSTHLLETIRANLSRLLSLRGLRRLLDEFANVSDPARAQMNRRLLDEMIPEKVAPETLLATLRLLLDERVSIRNLPLILEAIAEARSLPSAEAICDHVRQRLGFQITAELRRDDGTIPLIQLAPEWERTFTQYQLDQGPVAGDVALPPDMFSRLANAIAERLGKVTEAGTQPALVTSARRRRFLRNVLAAKGVSAPVLSYEEIGLEARPAILGQVPA
ncbi:flagellar biosynthesis protein FlhA [Paragemmobacter ruber]|uniref:Flagellar type III secretion system protein FlhA n=1 Tax=Paragemmobacter ruber TaxID=1985673 RepID=A0ABW9Y4B1_9RHOB|nr:flagellar biosynthesis protein FlhA [Rhodobacter ruber]NBE07375.1 flagellar type III secretion system protein FlhA [Rhodobacter ruber]